MWSKQLDPRIAIAVGVLFTAFSSIFIRLSSAPALAIAANRMILTTIMLVPLIIHERLTSGSSRKTVDRRLALLCILSGLFLAIHFATWIRSVELTTIASATVIVNAQPLFVVLAGFVLFDERISKRAFVYILIVLAGGVLLSSGDFALGKDALIGDVLALIGAISVAGYMIIGRYARRRLSARSYVFMVYGASAVFLISFCLASGTPVFSYELREYLLFGAMAFFCTILGHTLYNWTLKYLKTSVVATVTLGEPVFATTLGLIIFSEVPPALTIAGGVIMIIGLGAFVREESKVTKSGHFDKKAQTWDADSGRKERSNAIVDAIKTTVGLQGRFRVLDYGAGTGQIAFNLAKSVKSVLAIDTSEGMLSEIEKKRESHPSGDKISVLCHDLSREPLTGHEFDLICAGMTLHHIENIPVLVQHFHDVLAPNGWLAIADLEDEDGSFHGSSTHAAHHGFSPNELSVLVGTAGFTDVQTRRIHEIERERDGEIKTYGVFLLTACKA